MNKFSQNLGVLQRAVLYVMPRNYWGVPLFIGVQSLVAVGLSSLLLYELRPDLGFMGSLEIVSFVTFGKYLLLCCNHFPIPDSWKKKVFGAAYLAAVALCFMMCAFFHYLLDMSLNPFSVLLCVWLCGCELLSCSFFYMRVSSFKVSLV